ncbi:hypothetical protein OS493_004946 [Desmophyllum pertusum]|uniref:G-protein coupled receptors family 1 profile domain-containing protein n=1 Tax=Desmophyllum pertusum TaxID=174260 RepID=A0A9X0CUF2_9CNID|nr:hypothetical protein OS493_004946 [Desmophyllum pertusum]
MNKTHLACSFLDINLDNTRETQTANIITCVLNAVFSLITCMGNSVILHVIWKTRELHSPSFVLLFCLAASDLLVGLICQPFVVAFKVAELGHDFGVYCPLRMIQSISSWTTSGVSLLTLSAVSIDRLLALTLHLRYNVVVTVPRVIQTIVCLWMFAITAVTLRFWIRNWIIFPVVITLLTFLVTTLSTLKIFQIVRRHQRQIRQQEQSVQINTVNVLKCRKSAVTVLYVYGLFLIVYLPFCATMLVNSFIGYTKRVKIAYDYAATVVFINSFLNPLVYCWRIREIRRAVKSTLRINRAA